MKIQSPGLTFSFLEKSNAYKFDSTIFPAASFLSTVQLICEVDGQKRPIIAEKNPITPLLGKSQQKIAGDDIDVFDIPISTTIPDIQVILQMGLDPQKATGILRMVITNRYDAAIKINRITLIDTRCGELVLGSPTNLSPVIYCNGWQSWSASRAYNLGDRQQTSILGSFQTPMVVNHGTPQPKQQNHFSSDMFAILANKTSQIGLLAGFLSQHQHFGSLESNFNPQPSLRVWANGDNTILPTGSTLQTDWLYLSFIDLEISDPFRDYFQTVAKEHQLHSREAVPVGWCSWYHFYQNITADNIRSNLKSVENLKSEIPLPLFQIDDGFETLPGDWFDFDPDFPKGLKPLVREIKSADLTPGIWLAPFILHPKARLVKEHPDWILRDRRGKPVNAGFVWNRFTHALDLTNPDALDYACEVIRTAVEDWGFEYLKLDFLYAAALNGVYQDPTQSRAQVLRMGLEALRKAAGTETTLLGCGCPLGSGLGIFDAMRISADVSGHWEPHFPPISRLLKKEPHMPAARNAIQNILTRAPMHRHWWINDPDCLLVRPDTDLTLAEVQSLATAISLTGGSLLLSDDLPSLPKDRLQIAQMLIPVIDQRAEVMDQFSSGMPTQLKVELKSPIGSYFLLAAFNWENSAKDLTFSPKAFDLPGEEIWWLREFWKGEIGQMGPNSPFTCYQVPAHGVRVIAVRPFNPFLPTYLGGNLHLSQGLEISQWQITEKEITLRYDFGRYAAGACYFYLPWQPIGAWFKNQPHMMQDRGRGVYQVDLEDIDGKTLQIRG